jgi:hypothetical protein
MMLVLRPPSFVEDPESFLERSEIWRKPLNNLLLIGKSAAELGSGILGGADAGRLNAWAKGQTMGPSSKGVFLSLLDVISDEGALERDLIESNKEEWWDDILRSRADQTGQGLRQREELIEKVKTISDIKTETLTSEALRGIKLCEILILEELNTGAIQERDLGRTNLSNLRVLT